MLTYNQFLFLKNAILDGDSNCMEIPENQYNCIKEWAIDKSYISNNGKISDSGLKVMSQYKVNNAVIMAAGFASRFAPISYYTSKGLLEVKGEVLIERQIKQLRQVGINNITVVTGYKSEMYEYLKDKFSVKIINNPEYLIYNNTATLLKAKEELSNTYICSCDYYFTENVFSIYEYRAYYAGVFSPEQTDEFCAKVDSNNLIVQAKEGGENAWTMYGHAYFDKQFSSKFINLLQNNWKDISVRKSLWDTFFVNHIKDLPLYIKPYSNNVIYEFDNLSQLCYFDKDYINNVYCPVLDNICKLFACKREDIYNIKHIPGGLTNDNFSFSVGGNKYVYRHPNKSLSDIIDRENEYKIYCNLQQTQLDDTLIYIDKDEHWKVSKYIETNKDISPNDYISVSKAIKTIKKLHEYQFKNLKVFDIYNQVYNICKKLDFTKPEIIEIKNILLNFEAAYDFVQDDLDYTRLCHIDCYWPNFILDTNEQMHLIDWEYGALSDPAFDVGAFVSGGGYNFENGKLIFELYNGGKLSLKSLLRFTTCTALISTYWCAWAAYQLQNGEDVYEYYQVCKNSCYEYYRHTFSLYQKYYNTLILEYNK